MENGSELVTRAPSIIRSVYRNRLLDMETICERAASKPKSFFKSKKTGGEPYDDSTPVFTYN
jgi:hypothetical protein